MLKNVNISIFITQLKTQATNGPSQYQARYTEPDKKVRESNEDIGTREEFLNRTSLTQALCSVINKWDLIN